MGSNSTTKVERKCDSCGQWNSGRPRKCAHCGDYLDHWQRDAEREEVVTTLDKLREKAEFEAKPLPVRIALRVVQAIEFLFVTVIGGICAFLFWMGG